MNIKAWFAVVAILAASASFGGEGSGAGVPHHPDPIPGGVFSMEGRWAGDHISLNLTFAGGTLEYDCAHGTVDESLRLDADGVFDLKGFHVRDHGGPIKPGEIEDRHPARYLGHYDVVSGELTLLVILTDTHQRVGTYHLKFGATPNLTKCL